MPNPTRRAFVATAGSMMLAPRIAGAQPAKPIKMGGPMPLTEREGAWLPLDLWSQFLNWLSGAEPPGGRLTTTLASHQGIFGLGIRSAPVAAP